MIPELDARGLLPDGEHAAAWDEISARFCHAAHREALFAGLRRFVRTELAPHADGVSLVIGGSFLSDKEAPGDIELTAIMSLMHGGAEARRALLRLGTASEHDRIRHDYGVDFYLTLTEGGNDFSLFFRYVGEKTAQAKNLNTRALRGTVRVTEWNK